MTIIKTEQGKNGMKIYTVKKDLTDEQTDALNGKMLHKRMFKNIIDHDCDVYTEEGNLLLRFRKKVLPQHNVQDFYDNVIDFAHHTTGARGDSIFIFIKSLIIMILRKIDYQ